MRESRGLYGRFANIALLVMLAMVMASLALMLYVAAYVFPLIGLVMAIGAVSALAIGDGATFAMGLVLALVFIGIGSSVYDEFFVGRYGELVPITQLPSHLSTKAKERFK